MLIPNTSYLKKKKKRLKRGRKKPNQTKNNKLSDCKVISLVWISYLLAMHCCAMELDSQRGRNNARIKKRRMIGAAGTLNGI